DPGDDLVWVFDVAGLAVHAIGGVDLQAQRVAALGNGIFDNLVHVGGAEARARVAVFDGATFDADGGVGDVQMHGLILVVLGGGEIHAREAITRRQRAFDPAGFARRRCIRAGA